MTRPVVIQAALSRLSGLKEEHTHWEGKWRVEGNGGLEGGSVEQILIKTQYVYV